MSEKEIKQQTDTVESNEQAQENPEQTTNAEVNDAKEQTTPTVEQQPSKDDIIAQMKAVLQQAVAENERLTKEVEKLNKTVARLQSSADNSDKFRDQLVALKSDFDSYRRRMRQDAEASKQQGVSDAVVKMLPVLDDLMRAKQHVSNEELVALEMIIAQFEKTLSELGIQQLEVKGELFDPMKMNALSIVDMGEENRGKVVEVYKAGYRMGDKVLRYAEVIVGA